MTYTTTRPSCKRKASGLCPFPIVSLMAYGPSSLSPTAWNTVELRQNMWPLGEFSGQPHTNRWYLPSEVCRIFPPQKEVSGNSMPLSTRRGRTLSAPHTSEDSISPFIGWRRSIKRAPFTKFFHSDGRSRSVTWAWSPQPNPTAKENIKNLFIRISYFYFRQRYGLYSLQQ